jgi:hypothetical protein
MGGILIVAAITIGVMIWAVDAYLAANDPTAPLTEQRGEQDAGRPGRQ